MGLDKCTACIHHYSITQSQFTALKSSCVRLCRKKGNVEGCREEPQADKWAGEGKAWKMPGKKRVS